MSTQFAISSIIAMMLLTITLGCSSLENKSVAASGTVSAIKAESSGSGSTGTMTPNLMVGGGAFAIGTSPLDDERPLFSEARRYSFISRVFNLGVSDSATVYIGTKGETAQETALRLKALRSEPGSSDISSDTK